VTENIIAIPLNKNILICRARFVKSHMYFKKQHGSVFDAYFAIQLLGVSQFFSLFDSKFVVLDTDRDAVSQYHICIISES